MPRTLASNPTTPPATLEALAADANWGWRRHADLHADLHAELAYVADCIMRGLGITQADLAKNNISAVTDLPSCDDCPIGGREGDGTPCLRAPLCDQECAEQGAILDREVSRLGLLEQALAEHYKAHTEPLS
jgi:hypothetical protein